MSISLKDFMECVDYKITEGSEYLWQCYGQNVHQLDSYKEDAYTINIVFDTKTQLVYEMEAWDYVNNRVYRWIHPDFLEEVKAEYLHRNINFGTACDDSKFTDLDVSSDMLEKARAIFLGEDYDTRVQITLDLSDDEVFTMMKMAHEKDMSFNKFVEHVISIELSKLGK